MGKVIIGLGNPDRKLVRTRHNLGSRFVSWWKSNSSGDENFSLEISTVGMNNSGSFVRQIFKSGGYELTDLLLVHDELDLSFGDFRLQKGRGDAGHNGVKSVIEYLNSADFYRLRVGIGPCPHEKDPADFVLQPFNLQEKDYLEILFMKMKDYILNSWLNLT